MVLILLDPDTQEQQDRFANDPGAYLEYCKEIETEISQIFKLIRVGTPESEQAKAVCLMLSVQG
jgi:hypothetical protein